jgi:hypothetical protein
MQPWFQLALLVDADDIDAILGPLFFLAIIGALVWFGYRRWRLRFGASRWTVTGATIESDYAANPGNSGVATVLGGAAAGAAVSNSWNAVLQYSYSVAGELYSGYFILSGPFSSRESAREAARPWVLKKITVRYNPRRPHESAFLVADGAPAGSRSVGDQPPASSDVITLSLK